MSDDVEFDYDFLMQKALRAMMRDVLNIVAELGDAPGEHHFYIEFMTEAPGVSIPDHLMKDYPERMTIVLQHQFEGLTVTEEGFTITLWFKSKESRLQIPFDAVTSFADPSAQFGLRFEPVETTEEIKDKEKAAPDESSEQEEKKDKGDSADIVNLDAFRKK